MKHHAATLDGGKAPDRPLARGTSVLILRWDVAKIGFIEEPNRLLPEVCGFGINVLIPACSQSKICSPL